jgi:hypothetical protein
MKILLYFNASDTPEGVGQSQKLEGTIDEFIELNETKFINPVIENNMLTFTKSLDENNEIITGYAMIFEVPDNFEN